MNAYLCFSSIANIGPVATTPTGHTAQVVQGAGGTWWVRVDGVAMQGPWADRAEAEGVVALKCGRVAA